MSDFDAWEPEPVPEGFADRVVEAELVRRASARRRAKVVALASALSLAAAAGVALWVSRAEPAGEFVARERIEAELSGRAVAVLEKGAHVRFRGARVEQLAGDVFYRVERGAPYRVVTAAGEAEVLGTCFRVSMDEQNDAQKAGEEEGDMRASVGKIAAGAAVGALVTVGVYEGRVRVSSAGESRTLSAGESAELRRGLPTHGTGAKRADEARADAPPPAASETEKAYAEANKNLVENIQLLNRKITAAEEQKQKLERELHTAQELLAAQTPGQKPKHSEFDLSQDDWKTLAETGTVKFRVPCQRKPDWQPKAETLQELGLSPDDGGVLKQAYLRSNDRLWKEIKPLCTALVGNDAVAEKIGRDTCTHLVVDMSRDRDAEATNEAMRQVGEIKAGMRPWPSDPEQAHPVVRLFLALTSEMKSFEGDLAESMGPEQAHRVAFSDSLCAGRSTFGGPGPRKK